MATPGSACPSASWRPRSSSAGRRTRSKCPRRSPGGERAVDLKPAEKLFRPAEDLERVEALCLCPGCPAYPKEDAGRKKAYCLRGDSDHKAKIQPSDCFCESCEIYKHGKLYGQNFYCLEGPALGKGLRNLLKGEPITKLAREQQERVPALFVAAGFDVHRAHEKE